MIKKAAKARVGQSAVLICRINSERGKNAQSLPWNTADYTIISAEDQTEKVESNFSGVEDAAGCGGFCWIYYSSVHFAWVNIRTVGCIKKWLFIVSRDTVGAR